MSYLNGIRVPLFVYDTWSLADHCEAEELYTIIRRGVKCDSTRFHLIVNTKQ